MRALLAWLVLPLLVACARELELPEPPAPTPEGPPVPALLGALSGDYRLEVTLEPELGLGVAPAGFLRLMHLVDPRGLDEQRVLGYGVLANAFDEVEDGDGACSATVDATFEGGLVAGALAPLTCDGRALAEGAFTARPAAGVAGLTTDLSYRICPGSTPRPLRGLRRCVFNPSISGVYQGRTTRCDGTTEAVQLALGFSGSEVVGFGHPWGSSVYNGTFDPFALGGALQIELAGGGLRCAAFTLVPAEGVVQLAIDVWAATELDAGDGTTFLSCEPAPEGCGLERVEATRLAAGEEAPCDAADFFPKLWSYSQIVAEPGGRWLDVYVFDGNGSGGALPPSAAQVVLQRASDRFVAPQVPGPPSVTARFHLGDACDTDAFDWELFATVGTFEGGEVAVAVPACVRDTPGLQPAAREFAPCEEPGVTVGALVCVPEDDGDPLTVDPASWKLLCEVAATCSSAVSACFAEVGYPFCSLNPCDEASLGGPMTNGALWGTCDAARGFLPAGQSPAEAGRCLELFGYPICQLVGLLPEGETCRIDLARRPEELCGDGLICVPASPMPASPTPCRCDGDCAGEAVPSACDTASGACLPLGACRPTCDAGVAAAVTCANLGQRCRPYDESALGDHALGYCR